MSDLSIVRRGGGTSLNYKVVGSTSTPTSLKENTIWVNTSTAITSHVFSATQPTSPVAGMVWFEIGTSCAAPMSITKKDIIVLYPINCKQYENGTWVSKTAKTWQGSKWVDWRTYFFKSGEGAVIPFRVRGYSSTVSGVVTAEHIKINSTANNNGERGCTSDETVDLTKFSVLYFDVLAKTSNFYVGAATAEIKYNTTLAASELISSKEERQIIPVDVSNCSGLHYIGGNNKGDKTTDVLIYNIYAC